jgi:hypothetical protein
MEPELMLDQFLSMHAIGFLGGLGKFVAFSIYAKGPLR